MKITIENWMLLTINSNKELVTRGTDVSKKFFNTFKEAHTDMLYYSRCYAKAKDVETDKYSAYVDCGEYFVQMQIIDCSKEIEIIG